MKFILKDKLIHIVGSHGLPNNSIEGSVEAPGLSGYTLEYSINGGKYKPLNGRIVIPKEELQKTSIELIVRGVRGKDIIYFKSDSIPLTHAVIFGKSLEDSYPEALKYLLKEIKEIKEFVGLTKKELHTNMLDLVKTFEEIIQKGSLF
jgi:hypothetical protein